MLKAGNAPDEIVWWQSPGGRIGNGHSGATGGGVSMLFQRPSWQTVEIKSLNEGAIDGRVVPDVAALAGPPLFQLILMGQLSPNDGTSASAPVRASLIARLNALLPPGKRQRFLSPIPYQNGPSGDSVGAAGCTDIMVGNNASHPQPGKGYAAKVGFDAVTG